MKVKDLNMKVKDLNMKVKDLNTKVKDLNTTVKDLNTKVKWIFSCLSFLCLPSLWEMSQHDLNSVDWVIKPQINKSTSIFCCSLGMRSVSQSNATILQVHRI